MYKFIGWLIFVCVNALLFSQVRQCEDKTPFFVVNFNEDSDLEFRTPNVSRSGLCCTAKNPDRCIEFYITVNELYPIIIFEIVSGAIPPGSLYYQINCGELIPVGQSVELVPPGPYNLTFCKPGNNPNVYGVRALPADNLPIRLLDYAVTCKNDKIELSWIMASESNCSSYDVETSNNGKDWLFASSVKSAGNVNVPVKYQYVFDTSVNTPEYVRIMQNDLSGKKSLLFALKIDCSNTYDDVNFKIWQKTNDNISILLKSNYADNVKLLIFNAIGQKIYETQLKVTEGINFFEKEVKLSNNSVFFVKLQGTKLNKTVRLISIFSQ